MDRLTDLDVVGKVGTQVGHLEGIATYLAILADRFEGETADALRMTAVDVRLSAGAIADLVAPPVKAEAA